MAYDTSRREVIIVCGYMPFWHPDLLATWSFNITTNNWTKINEKSLPNSIEGHQLIYDSRLKEIILFGGISTGFYRGEVWALHHKSYRESGEYAPNTIDTGGSAHFGNISWTATIPSDTGIRFQFRSGITNESLQSKNFTGPDGTSATYYIICGQRINSTTHDGDRWFQYKAFLNTSALSYTPTLHSVRISYNVRQEVSFTSPTAGANWTGTQNISWMASDTDGDVLHFDLYLRNGTSSSLLIKNLPNETRNWEWNTLGTPPGNYTIQIFAIDDNISIPLTVNATSPEFTVYHNHPPRATLLGPAERQVLNSTEVTLQWTGDDDEGNPINYYILLANYSFGPSDDISPKAISNATSYKVTGLADKTTYYWTVVPNDGKANGTIPGIRSFSVDIPPVNHPPVVILLSPEDIVTINSTNVQLLWNGSDPDGNNITYRLFLTTYSFIATSIPAPVTTTNMTSYAVSNLVNGTTYYWAVMPNDGKIDGLLAGVRSFSIDLSKGNRLPLITAITIPDAYINEVFNLNITASDPDGDALTFNLTVGPAGMTINSSSGQIQWTPSQTGNFDVTVNVTDIKGGYSIWMFTVKAVSRPLPVKPTVSITLANNSRVSKKALFSGTVTPGSLSIARVEIFLDGRANGNASGTTSWSFELDTKTLSNGEHTLTARAYDTGGNYNETSTDFVVNNPAAVAKSEFPWWILALAVVMVAVGVGAYGYSRRKKAPSQPAPEDGIGEAPPAPAEKEALSADLSEETEPPMAAVLSEALAIPTKATKAGPVPTVAATEPAILGNKLEAPAARPAPILSPPVAAITAPEGFTVEDIFLMYSDGRLIQHSTRRLRPDMDFDIMTSMLKAVQDFVRESIGMAENAELGSMEYGENKILFEKGRHTILASVIAGKEPEGFRDEMKSAIKNIESEFASVLPEWDGTANKLAGAKKFLATLGSFAPVQGVADQKVKGEVSLKAELEFYQGFVRLKVAVKNGMRTNLTRATFALVHNEKALRLDHVEPEYERRGEQVFLGVVDPGEKKTVAFYLDPQICTESHIEGVLSYKDAEGNLETLKMPRKLASVVCPILFTDENINTAMLKRMASEELDMKDSKVFAIPSALPPRKAFELGKAAVRHHDLRLVREFVEKEPYVAEAWYFGKAKGREDRLVVRVRALAEQQVLEFHVASGSTLMLTGMLAELKNDLNKELEALQVRPEMRQVTDRREVDALATLGTLLERAAGQD